MFVTKRRCIDFVTFFCQYQVCLKCRKLAYESLISVNENFSAKSKKGVALTSDYICLQKMKKGNLFYQLIGSCSDKTEKGTFFLSILLSLKKIGKGVKFQDITPVRATFTNTIANGISNSYPF